MSELKSKDDQRGYCIEVSIIIKARSNIKIGIVGILTGREHSHENMLIEGILIGMRRKHKEFRLFACQAFYPILLHRIY